MFRLESAAEIDAESASACTQDAARRFSSFFSFFFFSGAIVY